VKKQPTSPYIIQLISPIVQLVTSAGQDEKQLSDKATGLLRSRIGKLKDTPSDITPDDVIPVLQELHAKARRGRSSEDLTMLSQCSMYLVRTLLHVDSPGPVLDIYRQSLQDFITRKASRFTYSFFQDFIGRHPELAWNLRDDLLAFASPDKAVNGYRQCQALQLIGALITRLSLTVRC
jgi:DNA polymerase phi